MPKPTYVTEMESADNTRFIPLYPQRLHLFSSGLCPQHVRPVCIKREVQSFTWFSLKFTKFLFFYIYSISFFNYKKTLISLFLFYIFIIVITTRKLKFNFKNMKIKALQRTFVLEINVQNIPTIKYMSHHENKIRN